MKQIKSTGSECRLSNGITIPAGGAVDIADENLRHLRLHDAHFGAQIRSGAIVVANADPQPAPEPEPEPEPEVTRETIAKAKRADLIEIIIGTGEYTEEDLEGIRVEDTDEADGLRSLAAALVFGDE